MNIPLVKRQQDVIASFEKKYRLPQRVVELGCGDGVNLCFLAGLGKHGLGVDVSEPAVAAARRRTIPSFSVLKEDLYRLSLTGEELIVMLLTLEHLQDDEGALGKVVSFLRPGGFLILSVPAHAANFSLQDRAVGHHRRYDRTALVNMLRRNGFSLLELRCLGYPWNNAATGIYNAYLASRRPWRGSFESGSSISGISSYRRHMPPEIRVLSGPAFRLLSAVRFLDRPFQGTERGTHFLVLARLDH